MKIIEGIQLKNTIKQIHEYQDNHKSITSLYSDIDKLNINSLQSFSFQTDNIHRQVFIFKYCLRVPARDLKCS